MSLTVAEQDVLALSRAVARRMGLHFPSKRYEDLWRGIEAAAQDLGFEDAATCAHWLSVNPLTRKHIEILASYLTIGETYFFREPATLNALRDRALPALIEARRHTGRRLRIWSAGCCTGEEPYSAAMILDALIPDIATWEITLLATDINPVFLHKAREGLYRPWSFRNCPAAQKTRYFQPASDRQHMLAERIRRMVTFEYLNLADDHYPSLLNNTNAMDVILCRNVLMYFEPDVAAGIVTRLGRCLVDGGWFVVAPSEAALVTREGFTPERVDDACLYRRDLGRASRTHRSDAHRAREPVAPVRPHVRHRPTPQRPAAHVRQRHHPRHGDVALVATTCRQAEVLYQDGKYAEAVSALLPFARSGIRRANARQWGDVLRIMARAYANQGMLDEAEQRCRQAMHAAPHDPGLHYLLATILQEEGHLHEARDLLKRTVQLDAGFVLAHFALGALSLEEGEPRRAAGHLEDAIALLAKLPPEAPVPESEGIPAGRLIEIIRDQQQGVGVP